MQNHRIVQHSRPISLIALLFALMLWTAAPGLAQEASPGKAPAPAAPSEAEALALGTEGYIYGYPLVMMETIRRVMTNVAVPEGFHAPQGQFAHQRQYPDASFRGAAAPNTDTLYSFAWLDLSREPYVLSLPNPQGRYFLMEMLDGWTDVFAAPGTHTGRNKAQRLVITGPGWRGRLPRGLKAVKSPTNLVWLIGRIHCSGQPADYRTVHALQDRCSLIPLSAYGKPYTPPRGLVNPEIDMRTAGWEQVNQLGVASFFKTLARLLPANPPAAADAPMVAKLARLGFTPGQDFDLNKLDPVMARGLQGAPPAAQDKIRGHEKDAGAVVNGWHFTLKTGHYGTDYLQRAYITTVDLGANLPRDVVGQTTQVSGDGQPLDGAQRYVLHFPPGQSPPVRGFWSLTMYDADNHFVANPLNRYALSSRSRLRRNRDGSLDLYLQKDSPGQEKELNWLPAPAGKFKLVLRLYWPQDAVLQGVWQPPAVQQAP